MSEEANANGLGQGTDAQDAAGNVADDANLNAQDAAGNAADGVQNGNAADGAADDGANSNSEFYGAPESYDFKDVSLPEGCQIDEALAAKFAPLGKELNLSQQSANKLANLLVEYQKEQLAGASEKFAEYKKQEQQAVKLSYEKLLNTDKEIGGGDATKMNAYIDVADVGYNAFATDELKAVLHGLNLDYHPAVIKHFHRLGKLCGNDIIAKTGAPAGTKTDAADILYGSKSE